MYWMLLVITRFFQATGKISGSILICQNPHVDQMLMMKSQALGESTVFLVKSPCFPVKNRYFGCFNHHFLQVNSPCLVSFFPRPPEKSPDAMDPRPLVVDLGDLSAVTPRFLGASDGCRWEICGWWFGT